MMMHPLRIYMEEWYKPIRLRLDASGRVIPYSGQQWAVINSIHDRYQMTYKGDTIRKWRQFWLYVETYTSDDVMHLFSIPLRERQALAAMTAIYNLEDTIIEYY